MAGVNDIIRGVDQLPAFPAVIARAAAVLTDASASLADAEKIIRQDEALTTALLKQGNSAQFGVRGRVLSIQESLTRIGRKNAMALVMNMKLSGYMDHAGEAYGLRRRALWHGATFGAVCAERIAATLRNCDPSIAYLCALVRDLGKLAIDCYCHSRRPDVLVAPGSASASTPYIDFERNTLGADHAEVGAALATMWGLPDPIPDAIRFHHDPPPPGDPRHNPLFDTVHAADILCLCTGLGVGHDGLRYRLAPHVRETILPNHHSAADFTAAAWAALAGIDPDFSRSASLETGA